MITYIHDQAFASIMFTKDGANHRDFEACSFTACDFSDCTFVAVTFIDCVFTNCNFDGAKINYVAFRSAQFDTCTFREVNFAMCDKLIFEVSFTDCILDFAKFYTLKIKGTTFKGCSIVACDFMNTDLREVLFDRCDLYRSEFSKAQAIKADFSTSYNYSIDPAQTKVTKALFSKPEVKGLLFRHELKFVE